MFEFGEDLFDRVEVWTVGWQEDEARAGSANGFAHRFALVAAEIVEDDDIARGQRWSQNLNDISMEGGGVDRSIEDERRRDAVAAQGGEKGHGLPMAEGDERFQTVIAWTPTAQRRHVGLDPGLINEHQPSR